MHVSIYLLITFIVAMSTMLTTLLLYVIPASKGMLTSSTLHARLLACSSVLRLTRCTYSTCLLTLEFCTYSMQKNITSIVYIIMTSPYKLIKFSRHPTAVNSWQWRPTIIKSLQEGSAHTHNSCGESREASVFTCPQYHLNRTCSFKSQREGKVNPKLVEICFSFVVICCCYVCDYLSPLSSCDRREMGVTLPHTSRNPKSPPPLLTWR